MNIRIVTTSGSTYTADRNGVLAERHPRHPLGEVEWFDAAYLSIDGRRGIATVHEADGTLVLTTARITSVETPQRTSPTGGLLLDLV